MCLQPERSCRKWSLVWEPPEVTWILSTFHLFSQVHGKNLYLAFVAAEGPLGPTAGKTVLQREAASGTSPPVQGGQEQVHAPQRHPQDEELQELQPSRSEPPDAAEGPGSWLRFHFGLFGSIRANEFSRANKANKRGDWKDPIPRYLVESLQTLSPCLSFWRGTLLSQNKTKFVWECS